MENTVVTMQASMSMYTEPLLQKDVLVVFNLYRMNPE
jgi:hypothetical protein